MGVKIKPEALSDAIADMLREWGDVVFKATDESLKEGGKVLTKELKAASPKKTGRFAKSWRTKKYKMSCYVGNSTTVPAKNGKETSLSDILEYSTTRGRPFIKQTFEKNIDKIASAVVNAIKKEV